MSMSITTDNHRITASYMINNTYVWHDIDVNGFTLDEIVNDMLEFWNDPEEVFAAEEPDTIDGAIVVGLSGYVKAYDPDGFPSGTEVDHVYVLITAEPLKM